MPKGKVHCVWEALSDQAVAAGADMVQFHVLGQHCVLLATPAACAALLRGKLPAPKRFETYDIGDFVVRCVSVVSVEFVRLRADVHLGISVGHAVRAVWSPACLPRVL